MSWKCPYRVMTSLGTSDQLGNASAEALVHFGKARREGQGWLSLTSGATLSKGHQRPALRGFASKLPAALQTFERQPAFLHDCAFRAVSAQSLRHHLIDQRCLNSAGEKKQEPPIMSPPYSIVRTHLSQDSDRITGISEKWRYGLARGRNGRDSQTRSPLGCGSTLWTGLARCSRFNGACGSNPGKFGKLCDF